MKSQLTKQKSISFAILLIASFLPIFINSDEAFFKFSNNIYCWLLTFGFFILSSTIIKNKIGLSFAYLINLLITINFFQVIVARFSYNSSFDTNMAMSTLMTTTKEVREIFISLMPYILISILYFIIVTYCAYNLNSLKKTKTVKAIVIITLLLFIGITIDGLRNKKKNLDLEHINGIRYERYLNKVPLFTLRIYEEAFAIIRNTKEMSDDVHTYGNLTTTNNNLQNVIILLGESQRRDALSLYGNLEKTTPYIDKRKDNLLIYNNAIAPSGSTILSVPYMLSSGVPNASKYDLHFIKDNVINLANQSNIWSTYWLSSQEKYGKYVSTISLLAEMAQNKEWKDKSHDESVLKLLDQALADNNKKRFIIIHINGSHLDANQRYPKEFDVFKSNTEKAINEYNNSVLYTDFVMEQIIQKIENTNSILIYLSDHGQVFKNHNYKHGWSKKGIDVPYFIWHSNSVDQNFKITGQINDTISTTNLYEHTKYYLGLDTGMTKDANKENKILTGNMELKNYKDLEQDN
ncbi:MULTISPECIES: phosphoethanolamine transferase [Myroides]|uniref:Sulfatase-like hydrolase/transferase n=1 Tax=Myroides albus TaxID=2562892 RepID=A0A6I3LKT5_9FLAO|nr:MULTISPECIES: phosphoethanolamine transferase [Myroides]MTG96772.1 sulfatase-like hydrolase/transferase [Myroides albus]MVX36180.1 sulfatase-like hydrolase/transferase [Myroides sp. LoEW2-1]UVD80816.1 phosphoethanolamine transferase [Myroides albus]